MDAAEHPVISVIASSADKSVMLVENGVVIAQSSIDVRGEVDLGSNVLVLRTAAQDGMLWTALTHSESNVGDFTPDDQVISRIIAPRDFVGKMAPRMHEGMVFITTDLPLHPDTRTGNDFVIMA